MNTFPFDRLRRYRRTPALRRIFDLPPPPASKFIWPLFVVEGTGRCEPIAAMPGQQRLSIDQLLLQLAPAVEQGIVGVLLFGQTEGEKDGYGSAASAPMA